MGFYQDQIVPILINLTMRRQELSVYRSRVVPAAEGRVLEIGIGSGLNLPFYSHKVEHLIGLEPSPKLLSMVRRNLRRNSSSVELIEGSGEAVPLENNSVDTVVTTWTLCSIPDADRALNEMHRVLRPSGRLLFVEHGRSPEPNVRRWQDRLTPVWKRIGGGCHLNRAIQTLIEEDKLRLEPYGFKVYSQCDEDGIIEEICKRLGIKTGRFVEIGVGNGLECNSLYLLHKGWSGVWIDSNAEAVRWMQQKFKPWIDDKRLQVIESWVTPGGFAALHLDCDLVSIDIDGMDIHLLRALQARPKIIVIEYNAKFPPPLERVPVYDPKFVWSGSDYMGASLESIVAIVMAQVALHAAGSDVEEASEFMDAAVNGAKKDMVVNVARGAM